MFPILSSAQQANVLTARKTAAPPVMDGTAEAVWQALPALSFKAVGGRNFPSGATRYDKEKAPEAGRNYGLRLHR